ncbi:hypothetical protein MHYP_G00238070 [Metynnis hypsauchen]
MEKELSGWRRVVCRRVMLAGTGSVQEMWGLLFSSLSLKDLQCCQQLCLSDSRSCCRVEPHCLVSHLFHPVYSHLQASDCAGILTAVIYSTDS